MKSFYKTAACLAGLSMILSLGVGCSSGMSASTVATNNKDQSAPMFSPTTIGTTSATSAIITTSATSATTAVTSSAPGTGYYTLVTSVTPDSLCGIINLNPPSDNERYAAGTKVTLIAIANPSYAFSNWQGDVSDVKVTITIIMNSDMSVSAYFIPM
jgi:hypothetical protein